MLEITKAIKDLVEAGKMHQELNCAMYGHDYRYVDGTKGGKICVCCGKPEIQEVV